MRSRLRFFALVGLVATSIDLAVFVAAARIWSWLVADLLALGLAATVSYLGNRWVTFRGDRTARWVSRPLLFALTALAAGVVDLAVLSTLDGVVGSNPAKVVAIATAAIVRWTCYRSILFVQVRRELSVRVQRPAPTGSLRLAVVIPAFNEGPRVAETIATLDDHLARHLEGADYEIIVADDGSSDDTGERAEGAGARLVTLEPNQGKGAAVKAGVLAADARSVIFTDADLAYPPSAITAVLAGIEQGWDIVVGSRRHQQSAAATPARRIRSMGGQVINRLTHLVLLGRFRDTQCGIKGFQGDVSRLLFERVLTDGFAFDVELFLLAEQDQLSLLEVPVTVDNRAGSSVSLVGDTVGVLYDLFRIRRWAGEGRYRPDADQSRRLAARRSSSPP